VRDGREEEATPCALESLAAELVAESARAGFAWELDAPAPLTVPARALALRRALRDLMRNAERHGRPPLRLRVQADAAAGMARLCVVDAGAGPPPELRDRLGEPFVRVAGSGGGTGLGLALVERVARAHGGSLSLSPGPAGFEAELRLPL
jgi:two-component system osmolarity sensor histidine kinase EnvZ